MVSRCLAILLAATTAVARTPDGFAPASDTDLIVEYNGFAALNGVVVSKSVTSSEPRIGTLARLNGTSYAVMMIDLDIPTNNPSQTNTLLHWMQTSLVPSSTATQLNTTAGTIRAFLLEKDGSDTTALQPYFGPNPPARVPLSHRYTQVLVDTSGMTEDGGEALRAAAAASRSGFEAAAVLAQAGLEGKVVAGNFYNVTNPGPARAGTVVMNATVTDAAGLVGATGTGGQVGPTSGTGAGASQTAVPVPVPVAGTACLRPRGVLVGGLVMVGMAVLAL
ncbi:phosphatidylethanolamine-binding protein [Chaetomium strumarium]|uniref:Phosphatidylethanolamine-binding protein n=1 Tax=Chaetomium strumarium TaxID=1170767 RepID=A0AAJ0GYX4_9PEZI|nr:phosphatidylethanolamine-binding protein [Chaetomium strumarium]